MQLRENPVNLDLYHADSGLCFWTCSHLWIHFVHELLRFCASFLILCKIINLSIKQSFAVKHWSQIFCTLPTKARPELPTHEFLQLLHRLNIYKEALYYFADMCLLGHPQHSRCFLLFPLKVHGAFFDLPPIKMSNYSFVALFMDFI